MSNFPDNEINNNFADHPAQQPGEDAPFVGENSEGGHEDDDAQARKVTIYSVDSSQKVSSSGRVFMTFVNGLVGSGMLALPHAVNHVGLVPAWILFFIIGVLNLHTMNLLHAVASDLKLKKADFVRLSQKVYNRKWFSNFVELNLYFMQFGTALTGLVFISQYFDQVFCIFGWDSMCNSALLRFILMLAIVLPIGAITNLHYLFIPNAVGIFFQISFFLMFMIVCLDTLSHSGVSGGFYEALTAFNPRYLPLAFSTILFAYEGIGLVLDARSAINDNEAFSKVLFWTFLITTTGYTTTGTMGALAFGDNANSVIFLNLDQTNKLIVFIEFGYLLAISIVVPTVLFPVTRIIENWKIFRWITVDAGSRKKSAIGRQLVRQPIVFGLCALGAIIPSFDLFLSFVGGLNFSILSFVIPVLFYNIHFAKDKTKRNWRIFNWFIMVPGICLGLTASIEALYEMIIGSSE